jgi:hypothetical protein
MNEENLLQKNSQGDIISIPVPPLSPPRAGKYVGITGFTEAGQINPILDQYYAVSKRIPRDVLMIGVLVSYKSFGGPNRAPRYPRFREIRQIFQAIDLYEMRCNFVWKGDIFRVLHYNTPHPHFAHEVSELYKHFKVHGVQLNIADPDPGEVQFLKEHHPDKKIILQINPPGSVGGKTKKVYKTKMGLNEK